MAAILNGWQQQILNPIYFTFWTNILITLLSSLSSYIYLIFGSRALISLWAYVYVMFLLPEENFTCFRSIDMLQRQCISLICLLFCRCCCCCVAVFFHEMYQVTCYSDGIQVSNMSAIVSVFLNAMQWEANGKNETVLAFSYNHLTTAHYSLCAEQQKKCLHFFTWNRQYESAYELINSKRFTHLSQCRCLHAFLSLCLSLLLHCI